MSSNEKLKLQSVAAARTVATDQTPATELTEAQLKAVVGGRDKPSNSELRKIFQLNSGITKQS